MPQVITAIYEHGVLHPVKPLHLKERQQVTVQIDPAPSQKTVEQVLQWLISIGRLTAPQKLSSEVPASETERLELARRLGEAAGTLLSEVILEERGER